MGRAYAELTPATSGPLGRPFTCRRGVFGVRIRGDEGRACSAHRLGSRQQRWRRLLARRQHQKELARRRCAAISHVLPEMGRPSSSQRSTHGRKKSPAAQDPIWAAAVMQSVLLKKLGGAELKYIKSALKTVTFSAGDTVYRQDEHPDEAYVVKAGQFVARERTPGGDERMLRIYREAASFGSFELLYTGQQRSCTVTCVEPGTLWVISRRARCEAQGAARGCQSP